MGGFCSLRGDVMEIWVIAFVAVLAVFGGLILWRHVRAFGAEVRVERAREMFKLQRERLEAQFQQAAAASGKPRGLRWLDCEFDDVVLFVRDRQNGQLAALVAVTIQFEAVEGSDMEGLPA